MSGSPRPALPPFREAYPLSREMAREALREMVRGLFVSRADVVPTSAGSRCCDPDPLARSEYRIEMELRDYLAAVAGVGGPDVWTLI